MVGLAVGDELISVNDREPTDIIEYQQLIDGESVTLVVQREGESLRRKVTVHKTQGQPLGLAIDSAVFDRIRTCDNHCSFCFIYQLPKGMRRSLYVKDDDFRLSFLYGNYTTLTRFTEFDLERIVEEGLSPLYVSIHSTNPELRAEMLRNPRGATSLRWLRELLRAGIEVHAQVVVCPGVNDAEQLERTLLDVLSLYPQLASVALVPVGVSDFSLEETMRSHTEDEARRVVALADRYQSLTRELLGASASSRATSSTSSRAWRPARDQVRESRPGRERHRPGGGVHRELRRAHRHGQAGHRLLPVGRRCARDWLSRPAWGRRESRARR